METAPWTRLRKWEGEEEGRGRGGRGRGGRGIGGEGERRGGEEEGRERREGVEK